MKILNLYAGIGGNRKLWGDEHEVTAIEDNPEIAKIYQDLFPNDFVMITDAKEYLAHNYMNFDFIWASPPCQTHSKVRMMASKAGSYDAKLPNMELYSIIIFLKHFFKGKWIVENVKPYYEVLIESQIKLGRHLIWSNFDIEEKDFNDNMSHNERGYIKTSWFDLTGYKLKHRKDQIIRNCVNPEIGLHILNCACSHRKTTE